MIYILRYTSVFLTIGSDVMEYEVTINWKTQLKIVLYWVTFYDNCIIINKTR